MTSWHLNIWKVKIWLSQKRIELSKWNKKTFFLVSQVLSFRHKKQTSKNVADTTFNIKIYQSNLKKCWVTDLSDETKGSERTLYFARCLSAHVDAIVAKRSATSTAEKVDLTKN